MKKTLKTLSIILGLLIIVTLLLYRSGQWLHSDNGQIFVKNRIAQRLGDTPVRLEKLQYTYVSAGVYDIKATGLVQNHPFTLKTRLTPQAGQVGIENIVLTMPEMSIRGNLNYVYGKDYPTGKLTGLLNSLKPYQPDHIIKPLVVNLDFQPDNKIVITAKTEEYRNKDIKTVLRNIALDGVFQDNTLTVKSFNLRDDKKGTLNASGILKIHNQQADFTITLKNLSPPVPNVQGLLDADINISGKARDYLIKGDVYPQKMTLTLPDKFDKAVPQLNVTKRGQKPKPDFTKTLTLDLHVNAPKNIYVIGMGLDAEFGGMLEVTGTAHTPLVNGNLDIIRGRYSEFGKTFIISKANLGFFGTIPPSPELDIIAETKAGEHIAKVLITGSARAPKINFSATPPLPEDQAISQILFGESTAELTPLQAVQLTQSVAKFSGLTQSSGSDPIATLRSLTGVDDLDINTDDGGNVSIGVKRQINDRVSLIVEGGSEPGSAGAKVEIELTPSVTLESKIGQDASGGGGIFWKRDY